MKPGEVTLLARVCRTIDTLERIDATLADEDLVTEGSTGQPRAHPLLQQKVAQEMALSRLIAGMDLPWPGEAEGRTRDPAALHAARERWRRARHRGEVS